MKGFPDAPKDAFGSLFARFAHSDFGPLDEPLFRSWLQARHGVPEAEANSCGMCVLGFWVPIQHPAYKDPFAVLDKSTVRLEEEALQYMRARASERRQSACAAAPSPAFAPEEEEEGPFTQGDGLMARKVSRGSGSASDEDVSGGSLHARGSRGAEEAIRRSPAKNENN